MATQKELKDAYKQMKILSGVYQVRNLRNGKVLVGSTTTLGSIWNSLKAQLGNNNHMNQALQQDWNEIGADQFLFEILAVHEPAEHASSDLKTELKQLEMMFREEIMPYGDKGYNFHKK